MERKRKRNWLRLPAVALTVLVSAELLAPAGPAGAVPEIKTADGRVLAAMLAREGKEEPPVTPMKNETAAQKNPPAAKTVPVFNTETPSPEEEEEPPAWAPVEESKAVEDTYFEDAVFLGDSRTEGFYLYSGLKQGTYFYAVGATVESVFTKKAWKTPNGKIPLLDAMKDVSCKKIYVMLGINELGWTKVENFRKQYEKVIDRLREDHPDAEIIIQSILPVSARQDAKGSYVNNRRINEYNESIRAMAEEKGCSLVDVAESFRGEDGCLPKDLTFEGIHLNVAGCKAWLEYLRTHSIPPQEKETDGQSAPPAK